MDKGEKRNFKLLAGGSPGDAEKQYIVLFDMIDKQETYNEDKLQEHFKSLYGGQFAVAKNYLYTAILKSLSQFDDNPLNNLAAMRGQIQALIDKKLFHIADKLVRKAIREAEGLEAFHELHQLLDFQLEFYLRGQGEELEFSSMEDLTSRKTHLIHLIENLNYYRMLRVQLHAIWTGRRSMAEDEKAIKDLLDLAENDPQMQDYQLALSDSARFDFLVIQRMLALAGRPKMQADLVTAYLDELVQRRPWLKRNNALFFIKEMMHKCRIPLLAGDFELAKAEINQFEASIFKDYPKRKDSAALVLSMRLLLGFYSGDVDTAIAALEDPLNGFAAVNGKSKSVTSYMIPFFAAQNHFMRNDFRAALKWNNECLFVHQELFPLVHYRARMLNLLIHFELENHSVVDSEIASLRRYLEKNGMLGSYETSFFKGLNKLMAAGSLAEEQQICLQIEQQIQASLVENAAVDEKESAVRILNWLEARVKRQPIAALLRARH